MSTKLLDEMLSLPASPSANEKLEDSGETILDGLDPELIDRMTSRRGLFRKAAMSLGVMATAPMLMAAAASEAEAIGLGPLLPAQVRDILNYALLLERFETKYYTIALSTPGLIPDRYREVFHRIRRNEARHVLGLTAVLGVSTRRSPAFDYTAGGRYPDVFSDFRTFAMLSQMFEENGIATYKGQAPNLMGNPLILTVALEIHSVEARHAAEIRRVRGVRPWDGAFDSPKTKAQSFAAVRPFLVV